MKRRKQKAPFSGKLLMKMPDGAERSVTLPSAEGISLGDVIVIEHRYKSHAFRIPLVRVEGGWDLKEQK